MTKSGDKGIRKRNIIIASIVLAVAVISAVIVTILLVVASDKDSLADLFGKKSAEIAQYYDGGYLYYGSEIAEQCVELGLNVKASDTKVMLRVGSLMAGLEFDSVSLAKSFDSGYAFSFRSKNIVFFSQHRYMEKLLFGSFCKNDSGVIFVANDGKRILLKANSDKVEGVDIIGYRAFAGSDYASISIASEVSEVSSQAFFGCENLEKVTFASPEKVAYIGDRAYENCVKLSALDISGVKIVGEKAFAECGELTALALGRLDSVGDGAFYGCDKLAGVTLTASDIYMQNGVLFGESGKTLIKDFNATQKQAVIPDSVVNIGYGAFDRMLKLESVTLGSGVKEIGDRAYENCIKLASINLDRVSDIGDGAFLNTKISVVALDSVQKIGKDSFRHTQLRAVSLPKSVVSVGDGAFEDNTNLRKICILGEEPFSMGRSVFNGIYRIFVGDRQSFCERWAEYEDNIYSASGIEKDFAFRSIDGGMELVQYLGSDSVVLIPSVASGEKVIAIGDRAFSQLNFIESVQSTGNNLRYVGVSAFDGCSGLVSLTLGEGVEKIGANSIRSCGKLVNLSLPNSLIDIGMFALDGSPFVNKESGQIIVGGGVLYRYKGSESVVTLDKRVKYVGDRAFLNNATLEKVVLPNGVLKIYDYAFSGCVALKDVSLPDSLKSIGVNSLSGCTSLKQITLPKNIEYLGYGCFYKPYLNRIVITSDKPFAIGSDVFAWHQSSPFVIAVPANAFCSSTTGACAHAKGKEFCYKHAPKWTAYRNNMEAIL